jgi:hypothetical protein
MTGANGKVLFGGPRKHGGISLPKIGLIARTTFMLTPMLPQPVESRETTTGSNVTPVPGSNTARPGTRCHVQNDLQSAAHRSDLAVRILIDSRRGRSIFEVRQCLGEQIGHNQLYWPAGLLCLQGPDTGNLPPCAHVLPLRSYPSRSRHGASISRICSSVRPSAFRPGRVRRDRRRSVRGRNVRHRPATRLCYESYWNRPVQNLYTEMRELLGLRDDSVAHLIVEVMDLRRDTNTNPNHRAPNRRVWSLTSFRPFSARSTVPNDSLASLADSPTPIFFIVQ